MLAYELFCEEMLERITGYYQQYCDGLDDEAAKINENLRAKAKKVDRDIEALLDLIVKTYSEALLGRLARLEDEKKEIAIQLQSMEAVSDIKRLSHEELAGAFDMARLLMRSGKLHNLQRLVELFVDQVVIGKDSILVKFKFAREYQPKGVPPKTGQCKETLEKLMETQPDYVYISTFEQYESQGVVKTTPWHGGEGGTRLLEQL